MKKLTFDSGHWTETAVPTLKMIAKYRALIFWVLWISKEVPLLNSFHLPFSLSSCAPPSLSKVVLFLKWNFLLNWWERALSLSCTQGWMIKSKDTKNSNDSTLASCLRSMWSIFSMFSSEIFSYKLHMAPMHSPLWNSLLVPTLIEFQHSPSFSKGRHVAKLHFSLLMIWLQFVCTYILKLKTLERTEFLRLFMPQ